MAYAWRAKGFPGSHVLFQPGTPWDGPPFLQFFEARRFEPLGPKVLLLAEEISDEIPKSFGS